jgi:hypothetical protein
VNSIQSPAIKYFIERLDQRHLYPLGEHLGGQILSLRPPINKPGLPALPKELSTQLRNLYMAPPVHVLLTHMDLKVHKHENLFGSDFEFCTF